MVQSVETSLSDQTFGCCRGPINLAATVSCNTGYVKTSKRSNTGGLFGQDGERSGGLSLKANRQQRDGVRNYGNARQEAACIHDYPMIPAGDSEKSYE